MNKLLFAFLSISLFATLSCNKVERQLDKDQEAIEEYLDDNNLVAEQTPEGIYYIITQDGSGSENPTLSSEITINYKGFMLDGTVFDQSPENDPRTFPLAGLIQGWQIGIPLITTGGSINLYIPSRYAYGSQGAGTIPGDTPIAFEIDLISFTN